MTMRAMTLVAMAAILAGGCGDDANTTSEGTGGTTEAPTTGTTTGAETSGAETSGAETGGAETTQAPTTGAETTGGAGPLTPAELVGQWVSGACEAYPNGMGGENYLTRDFTLTESTWSLLLTIFADAGCTTPFFVVEIDGPYTLGAASAAVPGATEGDFGFASIVWTAKLQQAADLFTMSGCGAEPWAVDVPQDVGGTGCIGIAHPIAECPTDHDIVAIDGDQLFFGERVTDMCKPEGRPTALNTYPVIKP